MTGRGRVAALLASVAALGLCGAAQAQSGGAVEPAHKTPIKHVITVMQENHSFDNYFGTYPGADGIPEGTCMPRDPLHPTTEKCVPSFHLGGRAVVDLDHSRATHEAQFRNGHMDGFVDAFLQVGKKHGALSMGYYDDRDLPLYWNVADEYVLFDRFFSSAAGGSAVNHMYWVSGAPGIKGTRDAVPANGWGDIPTIFDRLEAEGISWKFYVQNYDPEITYRTAAASDRGAQVVWVPLLAYARYIDDPKLFRHIVDLEEYYEDLRNNTLPSVAFMVPSGASEHPPGSIRAGESFIRTLLNELMSSDSWSSSAFIWTYDDWGGWYDHVAPPQIDAHGYGFRVPALLVSPYARRGHVESTQLDYTSILKFIEENWGLEPLAARDAAAKSIAGAFDFNRPPRRPVFLTRERSIPTIHEPRRSVIYAAYGGAVGVSGAVLLLGLGGTAAFRRAHSLLGRRRGRRT